jgi:phosphate transport system permease protein
MRNSGLIRQRRFTNGLFISLSFAAAVFGIVWLAFILYELLINGIPALSPTLFTQMTPPPGEKGGLANAILGSVLMSGIAVILGTPIGILAGTHLAEYGRHSRLAVIVRFVNDIMLSAPSIVIGLFVYEIFVANRLFQTDCIAILGAYCPTGHFSGLAGAIALSVIVIPVVVRTTENMLHLIPNSLREAASSLGASRSAVIRSVIWPAARAGMITGVLLAIARISGETAPLLFTALGSQFWSTNLAQPIASLPVIIFNYATGPYEDLHKLAWAGALLITIAVLTLSIIARILERKRS